MKKNIYSIITSSILLCTSAFAQQEAPLTNLLKTLDDNTSKLPQEKAYLHFDKPYYAIGDNIWFKAYVTNARTSAPSTVSNVLYVDLLTEQNTLKRKIVLPLQGGITWGDFQLPDSLSEGNYRIRAYTNWMRNAGPKFFFDKIIKVGNSWSNNIFTTTKYDYRNNGNLNQVTSTVTFKDKSNDAYNSLPVSYTIFADNKEIAKSSGKTDAMGNLVMNFSTKITDTIKTGKIVAVATLPNKTTVTKTIPIKSFNNNFDVQFFPESGSLIQGLPCKVAYKAINANGLGEEITGTIVDQDSVVFARIENTYLGMGMFMLTPQEGRIYTAKIKFNNGEEKNFTLPKVEKSGYTFSFNPKDTSKINLKIMLSEDLIGKGKLQLIAQHNGEIYNSTEISNDAQVSALSIPKNQLPTGVVQLTLFSAQNLPVAERIFFNKNNSNKIDFDVLNLNNTYSKRDSVGLNFTTTKNQKPVDGSFSIAVTNTTAVTPDIDNESNILTGLLLNAEVTGYIEKPNHYFLNDDAKTSLELDNLLLTQGWRKINWQDLANNTEKFAFMPEQKMQISGTIFKRKKPLANGKVTLLSSGKSFDIKQTTTDANGHFQFVFDYADSAKFVVQARTEKDGKFLDIEMDNNIPEAITVSKSKGDIEINVNNSLYAYLKESKKYFDEQVKLGNLDKTIMLNEVGVVQKKAPNPYSSSLAGYGSADQTIKIDDMLSSGTLSQHLMGRLAGVIFRSNDMGIQRPYTTRGGGEMLIWVDGVPMDSSFDMDALPISQVSLVESVRTNPTLYGPGASNGVIIITMKRGSEMMGANYRKFSPGVIAYSPTGYYKIRAFYAPKYNAAQLDNKPDYRSTVFWAPHVTTDETGKGNFSFFNTDEIGTYRMVIEGIDIDGNLARKVLTYEVK